MKRNLFTYSSTVIFMLFLGGLETGEGVGAAEPKPPEHPNILFLFADDLSFEAIGAAGRLDIETPNIDRIVAEGTNFSRAYNMGGWSGAICVASRTMLLTGRTLWDAHRVYDQTDAERAAGRFWPAYLKKAGYETYFTGKWHVRTDAKEAFDVARHVRPGMPNQTEAGYNRPKPDGTDPWDPADPQFGGYWKGGTHWSVVTANDAIDFLDRASERPAPFFMYVAFNAPHDPRQSPRGFLNRYPVDRIKVPENYMDEYPFNEVMGAGRGLRDERLAPFPRSPEIVQVHRREYFAIVSHMDAQIGRILAALEASGKADETMIVFSADHGLSVGHHGLLGKQSMYEHSLRVPFAVAGPGIAAGRTIDVPIYLQDIMPTTLEWTDQPIPDHVGFRGLASLLSGETEGQARGPIYGAYRNHQRCVIQDGHKLILYPKASVARLFDLEADPEETRDLAGNPDSQDKMNALYQALLEVAERHGDELDLKAVYGERLGREAAAGGETEPVGSPRSR